MSVLLSVVDGTDVANPIAVDVWGDARLEPRPVRRRYVAGENEPAAGPARRLDGKMRALDLLDAAEKDERRIGRDGGTEGVSWSGTPLGTRCQLPGSDDRSIMCG